MNKASYLVNISLLAVFMACSAPRTTVQTSDAKGLVVIKVKPSSSEVWVDGVLAGKGYDFTGSAKVLRLPAGQHTVILKNGDKTCRQDLYLSDTQETVECNLQ